MGNLFSAEEEGENRRVHPGSITLAVVGIGLGLAGTAMLLKADEQKSRDDERRQQVPPGFRTSLEAFVFGQNDGPKKASATQILEDIYQERCGTSGCPTLRGSIQPKCSMNCEEKTVLF